MQGGLLVGSRTLPFCSHTRSQSPGLPRQSLNPPPPPVKRHSAPANVTSPSETQWNNTTRASSSVEALQTDFQTLEFIPSPSSPGLASESVTADTDVIITMKAISSAQRDNILSLSTAGLSARQIASRTGWDKREGFFRHPILTDIFGAQWLRKRGEAAGEYAAAFNPVPLPTLALIATAIECALRDYVKGYKEIRRGVNEFSGDSYRGSYDSHLCTLRRQEQKHPQLILKLRQEIFQVAYDSIGDFKELEETTDYLGEFDLEADMMLRSHSTPKPWNDDVPGSCNLLLPSSLLAMSSTHSAQPGLLQRIVDKLSVWWRVLARKTDGQEHVWVAIHDSELKVGPAPPRPDERTGKMLPDGTLEGHDWSISSDYWDSSRPY
ncbi:hypothetical protein EDB19DRAFT_1908445 [Suillus lakei]|nr:hypothetical protein EDB19DRAFT_1908445 [Suillus lakei]